MKPDNQPNSPTANTSFFQPNESIDETTKRKYWDAAIGLQAVDHLQISKYLGALVEKHVKGTMSYSELEADLDNYYATNTDFSPDKEADLVAVAIYAILADETPFIFNTETFKSYHRFLFRKLDPTFFHPGEFRIVNITKKEDLLNGDTVRYEDFNNLESAVQSVFDLEKSIYYLSMSTQQKAAHFAIFTSKLWCIHPFREGNTRTTATFIQKHAKNIHLQINNELFKDNSIYFRGALVRANYDNPSRGLPINIQYLTYFFENLFLGVNHPLNPDSLKQ